MITRLVGVGAAGLLLCGFALTPEYEQQARDEVAFCVGFAKRDFPSFEAAVRSIDPATGEVAIERLDSNARGEVTFARCLMAIRKWRLVERHLLSAVDHSPPPGFEDSRYASDGRLRGQLGPMVRGSSPMKSESGRTSP